MQEQWRPVLGYEGYYEVSDLGRIRSTTIRVRGVSKAGREITRIRNGRILRPAPHSSGYLSVRLSAKNVQSTMLIHRVVAFAFVDNPFSHLEVNHKDLNKHNNDSQNLEWCSRQFNQQHAAKNGKMSSCGTQKGSAKLDDDKIREIRSELARGVTNLELSRRYGVSAPIISYVKTGKTWRHVT